MNIAENQHRVTLRLLAQLREHWHTDQALPARIQSLLSRDRTFGSRDRRLYRELIYTTLRYLPWIEPALGTQPEEAMRRVAWLAADLAATKAFRATFATGEPPDGDRADLLPSWFRCHCPEIFQPAEIEVQLRRAPLWLRLQTTNPGRVVAEFETRGWRWRKSPIQPNALEILSEADVTQSDSYRAGQFEVQDLGSQLLLPAVGVETGTRWLDACAGAGGKTLQLARLTGLAGSVDAHDVRKAALLELKTRVSRARIRNVRTTSRPSEAGYDGVLVDAPCSGSGTWRRSPHLKWTTTPAVVAERATLQMQLLERFAPSVQPGGRLVYATCSLSSEENERVVDAFLAAHADFEPIAFANSFGARTRGAGLLFLPSLHNTDGFFVASLRRR